MKHQIAHPALILACVALLTAGCEAVPQDPPDSAVVVLDGMVRINDPEWAASPASREPADSPVVRERVQQRSAFAMELGSLVHHAGSWHDAHRAALGLLEREPSPEWASLSRAYREQAVAGYMLQVEPLQRSTAPEAIEATVFYTRLLIDNDNRTLNLIVNALERLEGQLPPERFKSLVDRALDLARAEQERVADCTDCPMDRLRERRPELFGEAPAGPEVHAAIAIEKLEGLADRASR